MAFDVRVRVPDKNDEDLYIGDNVLVNIVSGEESLHFVGTVVGNSDKHENMLLVVTDPSGVDRYTFSHEVEKMPRDPEELKAKIVLLKLEYTGLQI